jgi:hypothetical protein
MSFKLKKKYLFNTIILLIIVSILFYFQLENKKKLFLKGKYTIGRISDIKPMKGGIVYYYYYYVNGKRYTDYRKSNRYKEIGDKCYVIFNPENPKENLILLLLPKLKENIKAPRKGWEKGQIRIDDKDILNAIKG